MTTPTLPVPDAQASVMLFSRYKVNQTMIGARVSSAIRSFWIQMVDPNHFSDSWTRLAPIISGIIDTHYQMSAADASNYYGLSRAVAGYSGPGIPGASLADGYLSGFVATMGAGMFYHYLDEGKTASASSSMARNGLMGASMRVVLNGGRNTVTGATVGDDSASGWERIAEAKSCSYCSGRAASGGVRKAASNSFGAHDRCACLARVVFRGQESANTGLAADWARETFGKSGEAASAAWDRYWSERNGSSRNGSSGAEAQTASTGQGAGDAAVQGQPVQFA